MSRPCPVEFRCLGAAGPRYAYNRRRSEAETSDEPKAEAPDESDAKDSDEPETEPEAETPAEPDSEE